MDIGNGSEILLTDPEDVLNHATDAYQEQFRLRNHKFDSLPKKWKQVYEPISSINPEIFLQLDVVPSEEEWMTALRTASSKSTPGTSNIGYNVLKKLSNNSHECLRLLAHWCYQLECISN